MTLHYVLETGSYTGNGTSQSFTIGWQPGFIQICSTRTAGGPGQRGWATKLAAQGTSTATKVQSTSAVATGIITITATGFTVGADDSVNRSPEVYHWWAIRSGPWLDSGSYTGADPTDVTVTLNRQPSWSFISNQTNPNVAFKTSSFAGSDLYEYSTAGQVVAGLTFLSTGMTATGAALNANGNSYFHQTFYDLVGSMRHFETGSYTGTGGTGVTVTLGRQPRVLLILGTASNRFGLKTDTMPAGALGQVVSTYTWQAATTITITATGFTAAAGGDWDASAEVFNYIAGYR